MFFEGCSVPLTVNKTVSVNSKSAAFLFGYCFEKITQIMKFLKGNFVQRNIKESDRKDKVLQILVQCAGNLSERGSRKRILWIWVFFFSFFVFFFLFFCRNISEFFEFESSLRFFSAEFSVEFSFSWIFFPLEFLGRTSVVDFHCFYFLGSFIQEESDGINLLTNFPAFTVRSSNSYWRSNSSCR